MNSLKLMLLGCGLALAGADRAGAQDPAEESSGPASGEKALNEQILGYWAPDLEANSELLEVIAKATVWVRQAKHPEEDEATAEKAVLAEVKESFGMMTVEIRKGEMIYHLDPGQAEKSTYAIKSRAAATGTLELEVTGNDGEKKPVKAVLTEDRLTLIEGGEEETLPMVFNRIDEAAFKKRQKAAAESELFQGGIEMSEDLKALSDEGSPDPGEGNPKPDQSPDGYPVAHPVPDRPGFVFSPYNNNPVDVRAIPAGTLVQDPTYPAAAKKYFRVP